MQITPKKNFIYNRKVYKAGATVDLTDTQAKALIDGGYAVRKGSDATVKPKARVDTKPTARSDVFDPSAALGAIPGVDEDAK